MKAKWMGFALALSLCVSLFMPAGQIEASEASVKVSLPDFQVKLNGHIVENTYREYPLLVYRGITYFPMTWNDSRRLGLEATWTPESGLRMEQSQVTASYAPDKSGKRNAAADFAKIATSPITVNGKPIDNAHEPYPLLNFRNMTYFPLTWRFAHDEFGWDYNWSAAGGLSIDSRNPQLQTIDLPAYAGENDVAKFNGYYYFVETIGAMNHVYRAPVMQPSAKQEIYAYAYDTLDYPHTAVSFQIRDNSLWFFYHVGGGVMGSDRFVKISDDGTAEQVLDGYWDFRETPYGMLIVRLGASAFEGGNLYWSTPGDDPAKRERVGDPDLMYAVTFGNDSVSLGTPSYIGVSGDDAYVFASRSDNDANHVYRIHLKTNETKKAVDSNVSWFRDIDDKLYYVKTEDRALYSSALDGKGETKLSDHAVSWFDSIDGHVFYTLKKGVSQFELYMADPNGEDRLVWETPVVSVQVVNDMLVCQLGDGNGVVILDSTGNLAVKVEEPIERVLTTDDGILLRDVKNSIMELEEKPYGEQ